MHCNFPDEPILHARNRLYDARQAEQMGLVNKVVPLNDLETECLAWCREILQNSPTALRVLKAAMAFRWSLLEHIKVDRDDLGQQKSF